MGFNGVKTTTYARPHNVGTQVQQLVDMGYTRIGVSQAADGAFDIEAAERRVAGTSSVLRADRQLVESLPRMKRMRDLSLIPEEKEILTLIIERVERG